MKRFYIRKNERSEFEIVDRRDDCVIDTFRNETTAYNDCQYCNRVYSQKGI